MRYDRLDRFDVEPLLVATGGAIEAFGRDLRRLRPDLILGGVPDLTKREWEGRQLRIGGARIGVVNLRQRCIMTTFDPDTLEQGLDVLLRLVPEASEALDAHWKLRTVNASDREAICHFDSNPDG